MAQPLALITVLDTPQNRSSQFWTALIGKHGIVTSTGADGMWDVVVDQHVVHGVDPNRFMAEVVETTVVKAVTHRLVNTFIILGILAVIAAVLLLAHKVSP